MCTDQVKDILVCLYGVEIKMRSYLAFSLTAIYGSLLIT